MYNLDVINMLFPNYHLLNEKKLCYQQSMKNSENTLKLKNEIITEVSKIPHDQFAFALINNTSINFSFLKQKHAALALLEKCSLYTTNNIAT